MAWFSGKVSLGNFPDLAGAVNKLQESVKNIEKNFDTALGFEEKEKLESANEASGLWPSSTERKALFDPVMSFMGQKNEDDTVESSQKAESSEAPPKVEKSPAELESSPKVEISSVEPKSPPKVEKSSVEPESLPKVEKSSVEPESSPKVEKSSVEPEPPQCSSAVDEKDGVSETLPHSATEQTAAKEENDVAKEKKDENHAETAEETKTLSSEPERSESQSPSVPVEATEPTMSASSSDFVGSQEEDNKISVGGPSELSESAQGMSGAVNVGEVEVGSTALHSESHDHADVHENADAQKAHKENDNEIVTQAGDIAEVVSMVEPEESTESLPRDVEPSAIHSVSTEVTHSAGGSPTNQLPSVYTSNEASDASSELVFKQKDAIIEEPGIGHRVDENETNYNEQRLSSGQKSDSSDTGANVSDASNALLELEKVKKEMKMMEAALQGAARQAQAKADEIAKFMNENEQLKTVVEDLKRKSSEAEVESLREEYHKRVATLERKVYALTKERDTLRREQNKKSDAAALLKEKDEIITQVMAEGEELSKKQATQEGLIRKLRAQIREFEEEKKGLTTKLQVEENKVESIKRDKTATEKLLQETIEKHQTELAAQKEYYTNALAAAKEAEAMAEARANDEARSELESRLRDAQEREAMLVQALEELRQTLTRTEQQAVFKEDMLRRDVEDLQKRYQASERRCEELITQVPESTRPLLRQIEAMQETTSRRAEAWAAVERSLTNRLQEAEAKAAAAEERERSVNERLSQTLSRINVLEAQISCLRAEQSQLSKSLEKERQRAAENRQEYLAAKEEADTQEGRANQLEEEIRELRRKHKQELQDALMHRELLQQEVEREKAARLDLERTSRVRSATVSDQTTITRQSSAFENGSLNRKLSSASSLGSMEESYFLQASLDSSDSFSERRNAGEATMTPYYMKSMTPSAFEASLRQKEGELASYMSRLASMESIRDSLAEELVKMTEQCEKLRAEAGMLPGIRAELDALRRRHSAALELMGERDEELEELRADIVDLKEMYREQVNLLVNKIQIMSSAVGS
ncbi:golgin candidate 5 [Rosa rugosa]|uniref:golgin candidate 5 n=1 Tax=Rosa rugosa TaxID=74645 RepID=UPI002B40CE59|nr:golgin candidate 5 [Rosa rugosa]XP_062008398.1 golgin candidate 5 [Rosa rugosa]